MLNLPPIRGGALFSFASGAPMRGSRCEIRGGWRRNNQGVNFGWRRRVGGALQSCTMRMIIPTYVGTIYLGRRDSANHKE